MDIFRYKKRHQYIAINQLSLLLGPDTSRALPLFHAFTGCDSSSQSFSSGKKTAWKIWKGLPDLAETLMAINNDPGNFSIKSKHMAILERFVVLLYSESCPVTRVNQARKYLFSKGKKSLDTIPPAQAALFEHSKRSALQAVFIWRHVFERQQTIPSYTDWGWVMTEKKRAGPFLDIPLRC